MTSLDGSARLHIGLIIPSSNRLTEAQFGHYAPADVSIHVTRLRMTGPHHRPVFELLPQIEEAAGTLADARCDVIVFHCTAASMEAGVEGERRILDAMERATGRRATSTASGVLEALRALDAQKLVLLSPYVRETHQHEIEFLTGAGFGIVNERCLGLSGTEDYIAVPPAAWVETAVATQHPDADAWFLSCTNIRAIEVIEELEEKLGRPVVTSNQAVLWHCLRAAGLADSVPGLGRLFGIGLPAGVPA